MTSCSKQRNFFHSLLAPFFEYCGSIFVDRFLWLLQRVKVVFIVVEWENEDTVSVVNEKQVVGNGELQEGMHSRENIDRFKQRKAHHLQSNNS